MFHCSSLLYAFWVLCCHGIPERSLRMCFRPLFAKLAYSLPAWFGLCTAADWARFDSFLRRCVKLCYSSISNPPSVSSMLGDTEHALFQKIISNKHHVLQPYLTNRADVHYKLRNQNHNKTLIPKTVDLTDRLLDSLSVLWHCWLGGRKGIRPVKYWVMGYWCGCLSGARCRYAYGPADATATCLLLQ